MKCHREIRTVLYSISRNCSSHFLTVVYFFDDASDVLLDVTHQKPHTLVVTRKILAIALLCLLPWLTCRADTAAIELDAPKLPKDVVTALIEGLTLYGMRNDPLLNDELVQRQYQRGLYQIAQSLQSLGYYQADITGQVTHIDNGWQIRYVVDPGKPVTISKVDVRLEGPGEDDSELKAWLDRFPLHAGDPMHHADYESAKAELMRIAKARGYFDAVYTTRSLRIDPAHFSAELTLIFNTGKRYRFGPVTLHQNFLAPALLERYVPFAQGEEYDSRQLLQLQQRLSDSDFFESVGIQAAPEQAIDGEVPIDVELLPRKPARYIVSAGFGTDTGPRGGLGYERRRINRYGHRFNLNYSASRIRSTLSTGYRIPLGDPARDYLALTSDWTEQQTSRENWYSNAIYGARLVRLIDDWQRSMGVSLLREDYRIGSEVAKSDLLVPAIGLQRVRPLPRESLQLGWNLGVNVKGAVEGVLSDTGFTQALITSKFILPLARNNRILLRGSAGTTWINHLSQLPVSQRFFTGGDYTVRGYAYNSLGPRDSTGRVVGGKNLLVGSAEFEHSITPKIAAAAFIDTGNAFDDVAYKLYTGVGLGLRWRIPLGTLGIDLAQAQDLNGRPWRLHITIGSDL